MYIITLGTKLTSFSRFDSFVLLLVESYSHQFISEFFKLHLLSHISVMSSH